MSSPSIPDTPLPGKDPPDSPSSSPSPAPQPLSTPQLHPIPLLASQTLPPKRPSPLRKITTDSLPLSSIDETDPSHKPETETTRPTFTPFFTLIHDPSTNTTHHPSRIHYLFSDDDDSDLLPSACIRSLRNNNSSEESMLASKESLPKPVSSSTSSSSSATFRKPHLRDKASGREEVKKKREERVVIIDVAEDGERVVNAASLSQKWQILNAEIGSAPTFDGAGEAADDGGLMLRIEGIGIESEAEEGLGIAGELGEEELQGLIEGFERKMSVLRKVIDAGEAVATGAETGAETGGDRVDEGKAGESKLEGKEI